MRYEKADIILQLALDLQASRAGISLRDIEQRYDVSHRTAQRMRDAILRNFPQAEEVTSVEREKRWRIPAGTLNRLVAFSADELSDMRVAVELMHQEGMEDKAAILEGLAAKIGALMTPDMARKVEPDLEAMLEAEGLAMRPGPRPKIRPLVIEDLREAVKGCSQVKIKYRNRTGRLNERHVHPYGFLLGHRHYLVAFHVHPKANAMTLFSLPNIENVTLLDDCFDRDPTFSLSEYAEQSFGIFQGGESFDVVWRFTPEAANTAGEFLFHPLQVTEREKDGSLLVRFKAAGDLEMAWHLYAWGDQVEVLEPKHLAEMVHEQRVKWPALP